MICGHLWCLWSFPGSWSVVISWVCGHFWVCGHLLGLLVFWVFKSSGSSCLLGLPVFWVFMSSGFSCLLGHHLLALHVFWVFISWVCIFMSWVGLWSSSGSVVIIWIVVCGHGLGGFCGHVRSLVIFWVCDHFLDRGLWSCLGWVCVHVLCLSSVMKYVHFRNKERYFRFVLLRGSTRIARSRPRAHRFLT